MGAPGTALMDLSILMFSICVFLDPAAIRPSCVTDNGYGNTLIFMMFSICVSSDSAVIRPSGVADNEYVP